jgi:hypothetical protein
MVPTKTVQLERLFACGWLAVLCLSAACGGATQEKPRTQGEEDPHFVVMKDGKPAWPPVGPGCDALVACCKDAAPGRPDVDLACQLGAATRDCAQGRKAVVELLDSDGTAVPATCR